MEDIHYEINVLFDIFSVEVMGIFTGSLYVFSKAFQMCLKKHLSDFLLPLQPGFAPYAALLSNATNPAENPRIGVKD